MTLYEIEAAIAACIDPETGEVDADALTALQEERSRKIENVVLWIKDLKAEAAAYKAEKKAFEERQKQAETKAESLTEWLKTALDGEEFKTTRCFVSYRASERVSVTDIYELDARFIRVAEPEADKTAIRKALKNGEEVAGAELVPGVSVIIK